MKVSGLRGTIGSLLPFLWADFMIQTWLTRVTGDLPKQPGRSPLPKVGGVFGDAGGLCGQGS